MAAYGWITRKFIRYGEVITEHLAASSVTSAKLASNSVNGSKLALVTPVAGAGTAVAVTPGVASVVALTIADAASAVYDFTLPFKCRVIDATVVQIGAGNAGNSVTLKNAAGTAITNGMNNASDKGVSRAGTIDTTNNTIAANAVLKADVVRAGGAAGLVIHVTVIPVA